jgi:hypothetical protein
VKKFFLRVTYKFAPILGIIGLVGIPVLSFYIIFFGLVYFGTLIKIAILLALIPILIWLGKQMVKNPTNSISGLRSSFFLVCTYGIAIVTIALILYILVSLFPATSPNCDPIGRAPIAGCD